MRKKLPLHIHISTLVIGIILTLGLSSSFFHYIKTSEILLGLSKTRINELSHDLQSDFDKSEFSLNLALDILLKNGIGEANNLTQRLEYLASFQSILSLSSNITTIQVGYSSGDFFMVRKLSLFPELKLKAPKKAVYLLDHINAETQQLERYYSDHDAIIINSEAIISSTDYDPRKRDWYRESVNSPSLYASDIYLFYFSKELGTTYAKSNQHKQKQGSAVIAADLTLNSLNNKLQNYSLTPSTQLLLINQDNALIAHKKHPMLDNLELKSTHRDNNLMTLASSKSSFLQQLEVLANQRNEKNYSFVWQGQQWISNKVIIHQQGKQHFSLLLASPENELVAGAIELRNMSFLIQLFVLLISIPIAWYLSNRIAKSLMFLAQQAQHINRFNFDDTPPIHSSIKEVHTLSESMAIMRNTINAFLQIVQTIASENNLDTLIQRVTQATCETSKADVAGIFLINPEETELVLHSFFFNEHRNHEPITNTPQSFNLNAHDNTHPFNKALNQKDMLCFTHIFKADKFPLLDVINKQLNAESIDIYLQPLLNRKEENIGLLFIANKSAKQQDNDSWIAFSKMLSNFSAVSVESRQLIQQQKSLMESFIELIASAIDAKSPYTGGHCQRVPELTKMLAQAASEMETGPYKNFNLSADEWEELHFSAWLHDCGKVTTPEYVVDKSTKLETLYDRIHEIRTRFEVLKRDAEIKALKEIATLNNTQLESSNNDKIRSELNQQLTQLDDDFKFIANCNVGGEFMAEDKLQRLNCIANKTWQRTLDDSIGISWEEVQRKSKNTQASLPCVEKLLDNKTEHIIHYSDKERLTPDNPWGFKMQQPEYKYNRGEHYNLSIQRGTLNDEERYKINDHIVQTIIMLEKLPYPKHLRKVPDIAGGHHEKMDGTGYPRKLSKEDMPTTARMMAIADIFEALTAADRPYKKAKTLSESLKIMSFMVKDKHIDAELFELFLRKGIYKSYADKFLSIDQIDGVDIETYLR